MSFPQCSSTLSLWHFFKRPLLALPSLGLHSRWGDPAVRSSNPPPSGLESGRSISQHHLSGESKGSSWLCNCYGREETWLWTSLEVKATTRTVKYTRRKKKWLGEPDLSTAVHFWWCFWKPLLNHLSRQVPHVGTNFRPYNQEGTTISGIRLSWFNPSSPINLCMGLWASCFSFLINKTAIRLFWASWRNASISVSMWLDGTGHEVSMQQLLRKDSFCPTLNLPLLCVGDNSGTFVYGALSALTHRYAAEDQGRGRMVCWRALNLILNFWHLNLNPTSELLSPVNDCSQLIPPGCGTRCPFLLGIQVSDKILPPPTHPPFS